MQNQTLTSQRGASDSVNDFLVLSNPTGTQNVSCLEFLVGMFAQKAKLDISWLLLASNF